MTVIAAVDAIIVAALGIQSAWMGKGRRCADEGEGRDDGQRDDKLHGGA